MRSLVKILKFLFKSILVIIGLLVIIFIIFKISARIHNPELPAEYKTEYDRVLTDTNMYMVGDNWLKKNEHGLWEMYIEGKPLERGIISGILTKELIQLQEDAFVDQIKKMIPSESYLKFLKSFISFFNRNIDEHVPLEYLHEIYGISLNCVDEYDFIAPNYHRMLNYHAAHDIGHALQNMNLVACTSFSAWDEKSADSSLIIGRNFDFYVGDDFAKNKIVMFYRPEEGHNFMIVSWASFIGAASGMNDQGLTITINAAKSDIPFSAATPIALIAREILQYASTIEEAFAIAEKRKSFVSEALLIGSAKDGKTAIIEKSPDKQSLVYSTTNYQINTNHFVSPELSREEILKQSPKDNVSIYRYQRVKELFDSKEKIDYLTIADFLRDQKGKGNTDIGMSNEKVVNQLIAHHSVIFKPEELLVWVSTDPFQLGEYVAYDLNEIFGNDSIKSNIDITEKEYLIAADSFMSNGGLDRFNEYKVLRSEISSATKELIQLNDKDVLIRRLIDLNPEYFEAYQLAGDYYKSQGIMEMAIEYYEKALSKEVTSLAAREAIEVKMKIEE